MSRAQRVASTSRARCDARSARACDRVAFAFARGRVGRLRRERARLERRARASGRGRRASSNGASSSRASR